MFNNKITSDERISVLQAKLEKLQTELAKVEKLEKSLAFHELILAKKVSDMNEIEKKLEKYVEHKHIAEITKGMKKIETHEELLFENSKIVKEILAQINKTKETRSKENEFHRANTLAIKNEIDKAITDMKNEMIDLEHKRIARRKEVLDKIKSTENSTIERLTQVEYQNKMILKYLKQIEDKINNIK